MLVKSVNQLLDDLAAFEPVSPPVISLYLNTQPNDRGRADIESFARKELNSVAKTYPGRSPERASIERDTERIIRYVGKELGPEANGAVIFACAAQADFFEAAQLAAAITEHRLYVYHQPHLYPLARLIAGDDVILPLLRQQLPAHLADKLVDALKLDLSAPEHEIIRATFEAMRKHDATSDQTKVQQLLDEYRAGGLAVIGAHDTLVALTRGQGDELLICANIEQFHPAEEEVGAILAPQAPASGPDSPTRQVLMADALVTRARQTGASVTFVEDSALLAPVGGVGLMLRYK